MSRDQSPPRFKPATKEKQFNRAVVLSQVKHLVQPFEHWARHILVKKILDMPNFTGGPYERQHTYDYCVEKIVQHCWQKKLKIPRGQNQIRAFILLCVALDYRVGFEFHIYYYHFVINVLKLELDWSYVRYKTVKWGKAKRVPYSLFEVLQNTPIDLRINPNQISGKKMRKVLRYITCLNDSHILVKDNSPYHREELKIFISFARALDAVPILRRLHEHLYTRRSQKLCYRNEIYFDQLPLWHQAAVLISFQALRRITYSDEELLSIFQELNLSVAELELLKEKLVEMNSTNHAQIIRVVSNQVPQQ